MMISHEEVMAYDMLRGYLHHERERYKGGILYIAPMSIHILKMSLKNQRGRSLSLWRFPMLSYT